jgi:hypothetical protein
MTTGAQDQRFANGVVIQVQTRFLIARLAAVTTNFTGQPDVDEKDRVLVQK